MTSIVVKREIDVISLSALLLSIAAIVWQAVTFFTGAQLQLVAHDQIVILRSDVAKFEGADGPFMHIIARMGYVNKASAGYSTVVQRERLVISIGQRSFEHQWYKFVTADTGSLPTELVVTKKTDTLPFVVAAQGSESHATLFQPWPKTCPAGQKDCKQDEAYLKWSEFLAMLAALKDSERYITLKFLVDEYGRSSTHEQQCRIRISNPALQRLEKQGWTSPRCV